MPTYRAEMMDAESGTLGTYTFEAHDGLMSQTPVRITRAFMEYVDKATLPKGYEDYEINATFKDGHHQVVTTIGILMFKGGRRAAFMMMIGPDRR
tara:strand:+ start:2694 stop:2978 length:285 start_codon:yes stop_codon:yes gene_type:complete